MRPLHLLKYWSCSDVDVLRDVVSYWTLAMYFPFVLVMQNHTVKIPTTRTEKRRQTMKMKRFQVMK